MTVGRYQILDTIGTGANSRVVRAFDPMIGRTVAIKLFPASLAAGEGRARAKANAQSLGRKPKLTPHQQHEAIQRRDKGESIRSIALSYNVNPSTISRLTA